MEEELLKRTEKEAELREAERAKLKAQEDAELSEIVKQSLELEAEGTSISTYTLSLNDVYCTLYLLFKICSFGYSRI